MGILDQFRRFFVFKKQNEQAVFDTIQKQFTEGGGLVFSGNLLRLSSEKYPNRVALIGKDRTLTFKECYFRAMLLSKKLQKHGVKQHDRVLLLWENSLEFYIIYFAIWQLGAVVIPVNIFLHERELAYIVNDADPIVSFVSTSLIDTFNKALSISTEQKQSIILSQSDIDWETDYPNISLNEYFSDVITGTLKPNDLAVLLYTSGTTGIPKGVMLSSCNVMTNAMQAYARLTTCGLKTNERFFCVLPLFHVFAQNTCIWLPFMIGSTIIVVSKIDRKLILDGLAHKPSVFFGFPALYGLLCLMKTAQLDSVKIFVSGADMLPDKIRAVFSMIYGRKICSGYGLTEAAPVIAINYQNAEMPTNFVGYPLVGIECQIRDDNENPIDYGNTGNLWIKGKNVMLGYYEAHDATAKILKDGWLNTGDLSTIRQDGFLAISGRSKDLIIHKGFNIYPAEIENILLRHPAVIRAAVIGHDDPMTGQVPIAFVAVKSKLHDLEPSLRELCFHNLASYKIPRKFICLDDLPLNATGKVDKKQLRV